MSQIKKAMLKTKKAGCCTEQIIRIIISLHEQILFNAAF